ncbi:hypothetical protein JTE90_023330 [Oedothorax gibbosus]|uniref:Fucosyltransferase n=1 Tax=Oedothorax gibbosus TaxID=931172 RepID=A0AAV6VHK5_9ARAC|nr:hypothetical protein JTE90_023330 [Oedothorax gibbosus]
MFNRKCDKLKLMMFKSCRTLKKNKILFGSVFLCILFVTYFICIFIETPDPNNEIVINVNASYPSDILGTHEPLPDRLLNKKLTFDHVYESRMVGFPPDLKTFVPAQEVKIILMWTKWNHLWNTINYYSLQNGRKQFVDCPNSNCVVTNRRKYLSKASAVVFHLLDTKYEDLPPERNHRQRWIVYNMEPPWLITRHHPSDLYRFDNLFNWTMGYREDSDIPARYGFTTKSRYPQSRYYDGVFKNKKRNVVWLASDCGTDSRREDYVKELQKYIDVDVYGSCGNYTCYPSQSISCYNTLFKRYKFYLSFENAICKDYVTEKFFNVFNSDIIPVVFGAADYSKYAPEGSVVHAGKYPQPQKMAEKLLEIASKEKLFIGILKKKSAFRAYLDPWPCRLCNKLHSSKSLSVLKNVEKWHIDDAQCKKWDIDSKTYTEII